MNKGSPGGILLIAFGVLFLRLAYTGRIGAVWNALIQGGTAPDDPTRFVPGTGGTCGQGRKSVTYTDGPAKGITECILAQNVRSGSSCTAGEYAATSDGQTVCVRYADTGTAGQAYHTFNAAGAPYLSSAGNIV